MNASTFLSFRTSVGLAVFALLACWPLCARGEYRTALLIGNSAYPEAELKTPAADVKALAEALAKRGFTVTVAENLTGGQMKETVEKFADSVPIEGTAVVYFSGYALPGAHGDRRQDNYFLPVDGNTKNAWEVARSPCGVMSVLTHLQEFGGGRTHVVLVDGCFAHPQQQDDAATGLMKFEQLPPNSIVAYAQPPGKTVARPEGKLSSFTEKLLQGLSNADRSLAECVQSAAGHYVSNVQDSRFLAGPASRPIAPADKAPVGRKAGDEWVNRYGMVFCWCPPGSFNMGGPPEYAQRREDEGPVDVTITDGFWISKYELTRQQTRLVYGRYPYRSRGDHKNQPVNGFDIQEFSQQLLAPLNKNEKQAGALPQGWEYALPSEAEWEYAARAGSQTVYYFGDNAAQLVEHGNFADKQLYESPEGYYPYAHRSLDDGVEKLGRIGQYKPNSWGLHDVYGNVWEWCDDKYAPELQGGADPRLPAAVSERQRVVRGGCWLSPAAYCRSAFRHRFTPGNKSVADLIVGYRLVIRPKK